MRQTLVVSDPLADLARLDGVPSAVVAARDAVDAVLRDRGLRQVTPEQVASSLLTGAWASAKLSDDPERWLAGSIRLSTELLALSSLIRVSPGQAMARAHALVAHGEVADRELGQVRPGDALSRRMLELNALLSGPTTASPVVLAAVAHAELATLAPFGGVDGIIARAVEHMVLIAGVVDPRAVIVPEAGHLVLEKTYVSALNGYAGGSVPGVRGWLLHCAEALAYGAEASALPGRPG